MELFRRSTAPVERIDRPCVNGLKAQPPAQAVERIALVKARVLARLPSCSRRLTTAVSLARATASPLPAAFAAESGDAVAEPLSRAMDPFVLEIVLDCLAGQFVGRGRFDAGRNPEDPEVGVQKR